MVLLPFSKMMAQVLAAALLLSVLTVPSFCYNLHEGIARSIVYNQEAAGVQDPAGVEPTQVSSVAFDLVHIDYHPDSPLHKAELSLADRIKLGVERSKNRVSLVSRVLSPDFSVERGLEFDPTVEISNKAVTAVYEEPLAASPGSYVMTISLGTPAQRKTAIADTGSDLIWLQCLPCQSCYPQNDPEYDPTKSSTYKKTAYTNGFCADLPQRSNTGGFCTYSYGYGDGSTTRGDLATDTITLTSTAGSRTTSPNFVFGCGHRNQGTFSGTDGLVGLGQGPLAFTSQLGSLFGNKFSYCLVSIDSAATTNSPIVFGDESAGENLQYTPLVQNRANPTFYYVTLNDISVGGQALNLPQNTFAIKSSGTGGVILDSGTTITQLIQAAYTPFLARLRSLIRYPTVDSSQIGLDLCYDTSGVAQVTFPTIVLRFAGVDVSLPSANSFILVDNQGTVCLAFAGTSDFTIIGNIQQQNYFFLYDRQNQRVGIGPADCDSLSTGSGAASQ